MVTVLIVEDDIDISELIKERLESKGYKTVVAYTGSEGIKSVNTENPSIITLDIHLPDMSGIEVLKLLKANKDKSSIPVIIVTSDDTVENECKECRADGFVAKPIDFKKLDEIIKSTAK
ncbi:MAG: response regulator [Elusimicrobiota bacterium]